MVKANEKFTRGVSFLREKVHPDFALGQIITFLLIAENEGVIMSDLAKELNLPAGTISRHLKHLSSFMIKQPETGITSLGGYGLVFTKPDLMERRCLACHLTEKGKDIFNGLLLLTK